MSLQTVLLLGSAVVAIHTVLTLLRTFRILQSEWSNFRFKRMIWRNRYVSFEEFHASFDRGDIMLAAILVASSLQLSHPQISKVLQAHSTYKSDFWRRIVRTTAFIYIMVRSNSAERQKVLSWLQSLHRPIPLFVFDTNIVIFATFAYALVITHKFLRDVTQDEADAIVFGIMNMADKLDPKDLGREFPKTMMEVEAFLRQKIAFDSRELLAINMQSSELASVWKEIKQQGVRRFFKNPVASIRLAIFNLFVCQLSKRALAESSQDYNIIERMFWWLVRAMNMIFFNFHYSLCPRTLTFHGTMDLLLAGNPRMENALAELHGEIFGNTDDLQATDSPGKVLRRYADLEAHLPSMTIEQRILPRRHDFFGEFREYVKCAYYRGDLADATSKPQHLGIIMDGNRRFSKNQGLGNVLLGHQVGANKLIQLMSWAFSSGVSNLTVWALSDDNLKRGPQELDPLFAMMAEYIQEMMLKDAPFSIPAVRFRVVGDRSILPAYLNSTIDKAEAETRHNTKFNLQLAIGYGGRAEIILATKLAIGAKIEAKGFCSSEILETITETDITSQLYSSRLGLPRIDGILRTSGENRLSGFALWESHHAEFAIVEENWPALRQSTFLRVLLDLSRRNRRLGA